MEELKFILEDVNLAVLWGAHNENFELLKKSFPKLKLIARGEELKVLGEEKEKEQFGEKMESILSYVRRHHKLSTMELEDLLEGKHDPIAEKENSETGKVREEDKKGAPIVLVPMGILSELALPTKRRW